MDRSRQDPCAAIGPWTSPTTHQVDTAYAAAVGKRFAQWVLDTARAQYDQAWLDYQYEIGLRRDVLAFTASMYLR